MQKGQYVSLNFVFVYELLRSQMSFLVMFSADAMLVRSMMYRVLCACCRFVAVVFVVVIVVVVVGVSLVGWSSAISALVAVVMVAVVFVVGCCCWNPHSVSLCVSNSILRDNLSST